MVSMFLERLDNKDMNKSRLIAEMKVLYCRYSSTIMFANVAHVGCSYNKCQVRETKKVEMEVGE